MVCKGRCSTEKLIKKYNIIKSVSQKYRRVDPINFKFPDNWHYCTTCSRYYQGPDFCPCCNLKTRVTSRMKKTNQEQRDYLKTIPEHSIKFRHGTKGIKLDVLKNLTKWEDLISIKRPVINPIDYK